MARPNSLAAGLLLATAILLLRGPIAAEETSYAPLPDPRQLLPAPVETAYNAAGTESPLPRALVSARRDDPGHRGFLLGMQAASLARDDEPLNVAPLRAETVENQVQLLREREVNVYLLDSPDPDAAREFLEQARLLGLSTVLLTARMPSWRTPPAVLASPLLLAERAGEMAVRSLGAPEGIVAYVPLAENGTLAGIETANVERLFVNAIRSVAPEVTLLPLDPESDTALAEPPHAVCLITEETTEEWMEVLRERFPGAILIGVGETPAIMEAIDDGTLDIRVRHDYQRILEAAIQEAEQPSGLPITVQPRADRRPNETPPE